MGLDLGLVKAATELFDYLLKLPTKLVEAVYAPRGAYLSRRERVARQVELAELREVGKTLSDLYFAKGSVVPHIRRIEKNPTPEGVEDIRRIVQQVRRNLHDLRENLGEVSFSSLPLVVEASQRIAQGKALFRDLEEALDAELIASGTLADLVLKIEAVQDGANNLIERIDGFRKTLDCTYGP